MRHKYSTSGIVLARTPLSEASSLVTLLTPDVGLIRARAQGLRKPGAKMAGSLQTLMESEVMLLRGKEGWRLVGALRSRDWFGELIRPARMRAGRIASLLLRLLSGESADPIVFSIFIQFLRSLENIQSLAGDEVDAMQDSAECLAALRILHILGVDAGEIPGEVSGEYAPDTLQENCEVLAVILLI
jgi:recombinational DNA repair protein (RecF pathway)